MSKEKLMQLFQFRVSKHRTWLQFLTFFVENTNKYTIFVYVKTTYYRIGYYILRLRARETFILRLTH